MELSKLSSEELRDYGINYLVRSGFVDAYVKKLMFPSDIEEFYEEFRQEAYLAILELKLEVWETLYKSSVEKDVEYEYEIRNYMSRVIFNTVKSTSSNAYRKIKKPLLKEKVQDTTKWDVMKSQLVEPKGTIDQIIELNR